MFFFVASFVIAWLVAVICHWVYFMSTRPKNLPPGPTPWPLLGSCMIFARKDAMDAFNELFNKYGGAVTLYAGCSDMGRLILLMDYDLITHTFHNRSIEDGTNGRPKDIAKIRGVREGFGWSPYCNYAVRRTFVLRCFKELGLATAKMTPHAYDEMDRLFTAFDNHKGKPFNPNMHLAESISSCILMTVMSRRLDLDDEDTAKLWKGGRAFFDGNAFQMLMLPYVKFFQLFFTDQLAV